MKSKYTALTVFSILFLLLMSLLFLQPALFVSIIGFQKYSPAGGVTGSPFVGLANITQILQTSQFVRILTNTLIIQFFARAENGLRFSALLIPVIVASGCIAAGILYRKSDQQS